MGTRRGGAPLALVAGTVLLRAVRVPGLGGEPEEAQLADFHARPQLHGQRRHVRQLQGHVPGETRVDETGSGVGQQSQAAQRRLALQAGRDRRGQAHLLPRRTEHELTRVQYEALLVADLDQPGQFGLLLGGVDVRVAVVLEHPEEPVETHIDARRLEHRGIPRLQGDPPLGHLGQDVSVAQKHALSLMVTGPGPGDAGQWPARCRSWFVAPLKTRSGAVFTIRRDNRRGYPATPHPLAPPRTGRGITLDSCPRIPCFGCTASGSRTIAASRSATCLWGL